ncbi:MAG: hypothetical protein KC561_10125, partial [Myxococcales bacterium]|nr:hypothetical protein [Myxococcales bacterium]
MNDVSAATLCGLALLVSACLSGPPSNGDSYSRDSSPDVSFSEVDGGEALHESDGTDSQPNDFGDDLDDAHDDILAEDVFVADLGSPDGDQDAHHGPGLDVDAGTDGSDEWQNKDPLDEACLVLAIERESVRGETASERRERRGYDQEGLLRSVGGSDGDLRLDYDEEARLQSWTLDRDVDGLIDVRTDLVYHSDGWSTAYRFEANPARADADDLRLTRTYATDQEGNYWDERIEYSSAGTEVRHLVQVNKTDPCQNQEVHERIDRNGQVEPLSSRRTICNQSGQVRSIEARSGSLTTYREEHNYPSRGIHEVLIDEDGSGTWDLEIIETEGDHLDGSWSLTTTNDEGADGTIESTRVERYDASSGFRTIEIDSDGDGRVDQRTESSSGSDGRHYTRVDQNGDGRIDFEFERTDDQERTSWDFDFNGTDDLVESWSFGTEGRVDLYDWDLDFGEAANFVHYQAEQDGESVLLTLQCGGEPSDLTPADCGQFAPNFPEMTVTTSGRVVNGGRFQRDWYRLESDAIENGPIDVAFSWEEGDVLSAWELKGG